MGGSKDYPARIEAKIAKMFGITVSNSLKPKGKDQGTVKGWYGVQIIDPDLSNGLFQLPPPYVKYFLNDNNK